MNIRAPKGLENPGTQATPISKPDKGPYVPNAQPPVETVRDRIDRSIRSTNKALRDLWRSDIANKFMATLDSMPGGFTLDEMIRLQTVLKDITQEHVRTDGKMDPRTIGLLDQVLERGKGAEFFAGFDQIISVNQEDGIVIPWYDPTKERIQARSGALRLQEFNTSGIPTADREKFMNTYFGVYTIKEALALLRMTPEKQNALEASLVEYVRDQGKLISWYVKNGMTMSEHSKVRLILEWAMK